LKLERLNVFVGVAQADEAKKSDPQFQALLQVIETERAACTPVDA